MPVNLTPSTLNQVHIDVRADYDYLFEQIFQQRVAEVKQLISEFGTTDQDSVTFNWLEDAIGLKEGVRGRPVRLRNLLGGQSAIEVAKWEDGVEISHHDLISDRLGIINRRMSTLAFGAAMLQRNLLLRAMQLGTTSAYNVGDGLPWFDNAHVKGGTTFDNRLGPLVLNAVNYQVARTAMQRFPSDDPTGMNPVLGIMPNILAVPPELEYIAKELMENTSVAGGAGEWENVIQGMSQVIVCQELTDANNWFLFSTQGPVAPTGHIGKTGKSPFKPNVIGTDPQSAEYRAEKLVVEGFTYEAVYPTRPEFALVVEN